jgi:uncharacterized protein YggU (UPF0235/DUF167 family)
MTRHNACNWKHVNLPNIVIRLHKLLFNVFINTLASFCPVPALSGKTAQQKSTIKLAITQAAEAGRAAKALLKFPTLMRRAFKHKTGSVKVWLTR